jgi:tetratricopeptide (TPR) repeat protein
MMRLCNMADLSTMLGDKAAAMEQIGEAIEISRRIDAKAYLAHNLAVKADICLATGKGEEALEAAREAVSLAEGSDNMDNRVHSLVMLASAQSAAGMHEAAMESSARAVELAEEGKNFELGPERAYVCRYEVMAKAGRVEDARGFLDKALSFVMRKAEGIPEPGMRRQFLENNGVYRKLKELGAVS